MKRILLVDDEVALRFLITVTLSDEGYEITEAEDGEEAVQKLKEEQFDLVILDYMMPGKTGIEVCEWLRSSSTVNQKAPVILLTAKAQETDRERAKQIGVNHYITKPFSPLHLLDVVHEWIQTP